MIGPRLKRKKISSKTPLIPNRELAKLARVPPEHQDFFFREVSLHLQASHDLNLLAKGALGNERGAALRRAALGLHERLGDLKNGERKLIEDILNGRGQFIFERIAGDGFNRLLETTSQIARLLSLVAGKPQPRSPSQSPQTLKRGRKPGGTKDPASQEFVWSLLISTRAAGGRLTLEKTGRFGTLIDAIEMLTPYLPETFVALRPTTLQRIKTQCDKIFDALDKD
jgi:hypothetical protein